MRVVSGVIVAHAELAGRPGNEARRQAREEKEEDMNKMSNHPIHSYYSQGINLNIRTQARTKSTHSATYCMRSAYKGQRSNDGIQNMRLAGES